MERDARCVTLCAVHDSEEDAKKEGGSRGKRSFRGKKRKRARFAVRLGETKEVNGNVDVARAEST